MHPTLYRLHVGSLEQLTAYFVKGSFEAFGPFVWYERECGGCVLWLLDPHMVPDRIRHIVNFARQRF